MCECVFLDAMRFYHTRISKANDGYVIASLETLWICEKWLDITRILVIQLIGTAVRGANKSRPGGNLEVGDRFVANTLAQRCGSRRAQTEGGNITGNPKSWFLSFFCA